MNAKADAKPPKSPQWLIAPIKWWPFSPCFGYKFSMTFNTTTTTNNHRIVYVYWDLNNIYHFIIIYSSFILILFVNQTNKLLRKTNVKRHSFVRKVPLISTRTYFNRIRSTKYKQVEQDGSNMDEYDEYYWRYCIEWNAQTVAWIPFNVGNFRSTESSIPINSLLSHGGFSIRRKFDCNHCRIVWTKISCKFTQISHQFGHFRYIVRSVLSAIHLYGFHVWTVDLLSVAMSVGSIHSNTINLHYLIYTYTDQHWKVSSKIKTFM